MISPEDLRKIRNEIKTQLNIILSGSAGANDSIENETINSLYPGTPPIAARPLMHPYGLVSRAPESTIQVTARQGADATNRMVLGHRDKLRAALGLDEGETCIYSSDGETILSKVLLSNSKGIVGTIGLEGKLSITKGNAEFVASVIKLLQDIQNAFTVTMLGNQPLVMPTFAEDLLQLQTFAGT